MAFVEAVILMHGTSTLSKMKECGREQADRATDENIFDPDNAHVPLQRGKNTEEHHGKCSKACLACRKADCAHDCCSRGHKSSSGKPAARIAEGDRALSVDPGCPGVWLAPAGRQGI